MSDRKQLKKHIRAARSWLGQAENSLDKENDIQGDLKVMLAQAELQRARETEQPKKWRRWLRVAMPLATAVLIAALAGILPLPSNDDVKSTVISNNNSGVTVQSDAADSSLPQLTKQPDTAIKSVSASESSLNNNQPAAANDKAVQSAGSTALTPDTGVSSNAGDGINQMTDTGEVRDAAGAGVEALQQQEKVNSGGEGSADNIEARVPDQDMQKLMQSAGRALRAH